jgi:hypothetical protein
VGSGRTVGYRIVADAIDRTPPDRAEVLAALAFVPRLRRELDGLERAAIDVARRSGASWSDIALALGLGSRQAAEQRRLRLGGDAVRPADRPPPAPSAPAKPTFLSGPMDGQVSAMRDVARARRQRAGQRDVDSAAGERVVEVRRAAADLAVALDATGGRAGLGPAAFLARRTLDVALTADPGPLFDLARLAVDDLTMAAGPTERADGSGSDTPAHLPASVWAALSRLRKLTEAAT